MTKTQDQDVELDDFSGGQEVTSNWFKFNKVGDRVKGTLVNKTFQKSDNPTFADQWIYELKKTSGETVYVAVSVKKRGTVDRANKCKIGEIVGFLFESEKPSTTKGFAPTKQLKVISFGMDPNYQPEQDAFDKLDEVPFE